MTGSTIPRLGLPPRVVCAGISPDPGPPVSQRIQRLGQLRKEGGSAVGLLHEATHALVDPRLRFFVEGVARREQRDDARVDLAQLEGTVSWPDIAGIAMSSKTTSTSRKASR